MDRDEQATLLQSRLEQIKVNQDVICAFNELAYTAYETDLVEFKIHEPLLFIRLVMLAMILKHDVPSEFKM